MGAHSVAAPPPPARLAAARPPFRVTARQHQITLSLQQYRLRLVLAASLAVAWINHINQPCSSKPKGTDAASVLQEHKDRGQSLACQRQGRTRSTLLLHTPSRHSQWTSSRRSAGGSRGLSTSPLPRSALERQESAKKGEAGLDQHYSGGKVPSPSASSSQAKEITDITDIHELMRHPNLLENIKKPRNPIVLCHGLYGFDVRGPFWGLEIHYWASVLDILRKKVGAEVIVRGVPGTGAIAHRALELHKFLCSEESGVRGRSINFVGHSMGGLDARHIISVIKPKPEEYRPVSLTTISTPHRGSPFMDWCNANVGTGNDRVEAEIREARKRLGKHGLSTSEMQEASEAAGKGTSKLPFSLKTPLFVRPTKEKAGAEENEGVTDAVKMATADLAAKVTAVSSTRATSPSEKEEEEKGKGGSSPSSSTSPAKESADNGGKKKEDSSLLSFTAFNKALSSIGGSFSSYMLGVLDQPAYAMLSTRYMSQVFNPSVPNSPDVAYFSVASRKRSLPIWHPLWLPKLVLDAAAESRSAGGERDGSGDALGGEMQGNDGLVSVESAKWGTFLGVMDGCDHWDLRGGGAPRWRGRVNPSTGKAWPDEDKEKEKSKEMEKAEKEKKKDKSWIDVNTVLGKLLQRKQPDEGEKRAAIEQSGTQQAPKATEQSMGAKAAEKSSNNSTEDQGLLDEVATWISDRLPQGDEGRRAEAERMADEHDRKSQTYQPSPQTPSPGTDTAREVKEEARALEMSKTTVKLRRDAAWQEELGHDEAARDLRRELAWHRAEWDRFIAAKQQQQQQSSQTSGSDAIAPPRPYPQRRELDWDRHLKQRAEEGDGKKKADEANELERFWIAICRHLWSHGY